MLEELNKNVAEVNRQLEAEDEAAAAIQADIEKKQAELEAQRQQQNVTLPVSSTGFQWPLPGSNLKLTSAFGYRIHPVTHVPHSHTGIDVSATTGTPITAAKSRLSFRKRVPVPPGLMVNMWSLTTETVPPRYMPI